MGRRRERNESSPPNNAEGNDPQLDSAQLSSSPLPPTKKQKTRLHREEYISIGDEISQTQNEQERPKSKKELRAEKKKATRLARDPIISSSILEAEKRRLKKEEEREKFRQLIKEERQIDKARKQKKLNREKNAPGGGHANASSSVPKKSHPTSDSNNAPSKIGNKKKLSPKTIAIENEEDDVNRKIMDEIKHGKIDTSGWTTLQLGVKYKDIVIGKGPLVQHKSLVTVKYQLKGGKFGVVLDSSKKFNFRVGKGEVIQGWEIGVAGMHEGGRRQLIVPPKAGYGSKDIGAGPGGLLHFDITVLAVLV